MTANLKLKEGDKAPRFSGITAQGEKIDLAEQNGKKVVLYFYPKDDTPGCTKEACSFRDMFADIKAEGAVVIGVSKDGAKSHEKFAAKYRLNFPLLVDEEGKIIEAYGAFKEKSMFGKTFLGIERSTFLIDGDGVIRKIWRAVKVDKHVEEVLEEIKKL